MICETHAVREKAFDTAAGSLSALSPVPFTFGPAERRLFGWYHAPRAGAEKHVALVLCRPLHYEAVCTYAFYRYFAEELAHAGYAALRFDYDGTGDSFGDDAEPGRVPAWRESVDHAIEALRDGSGTDTVVLFGMRLGATLAACVAAERGDVSGLVLWGACPTGRNYLREMRALRAAHRSMEEPQENADASAYEEAAGFVITAETATDLGELDAAALPNRPAERVLLIDRDDLSGEKRLGKRFADLGTSVTTAAWPGYAALMRDAQDTQIPHTTIAEIIGWLDRERFAAAPLYPRSSPGRFLTQPRRLEAETYFEEPLLRNGSFGILTRPCARTPRSRTVVVLLSVGANPHLGPNRMYVTLARALAAQGFTVFRLDVTGVGDSARGSETGRDSIYSASARDDVRTTLDDLERTGAENFTLVGLCSGAYIAYQIASTDARVKAQVLLNVQAFEWHEGDSVEVRLTQSYKPTTAYFSSLPDSGTLKRLFLGQIDVKGIVGALRTRFAARAALEAKNIGALLRYGRRYETSVCRALRQTAERGTGTLFVFADEDYGIEVTASHIGTKGQRIRATHRPAIEVIAQSDHTFTQKTGRDQMLGRVVEYLCAVFPDTRR